MSSNKSLADRLMCLFLAALISTSTGVARAEDNPRQAMLKALVRTNIPLLESEQLRFLESEVNPEDVAIALRQSPVEKRAQDLFALIVEEVSGANPTIRYALTDDAMMEFFSSSYLLLKLIKNNQTPLADHVYKAWLAATVRLDFKKLNPAEQTEYMALMERIYAEAFLSAGPWNPDQMSAANEFFRNKVETQVKNWGPAFDEYLKKWYAKEPWGDAKQFARAIGAALGATVIVGPYVLEPLVREFQTFNFESWSAKLILYPTFVMFLGTIGLAPIGTAAYFMSLKGHAFFYQAQRRSFFLGRTRVLHRCETMLGVKSE